MDVGYSFYTSVFVVYRPSQYAHNTEVLHLRSLSLRFFDEGRGAPVIATEFNFYSTQLDLHQLPC